MLGALLAFEGGKGWLYGLWGRPGLVHAHLNLLAGLVGLALAMGAGPLGFLAGPSGVLAAAGTVLFGYNMWMSLMPAGETPGGGPR